MQDSNARKERKMKLVITFEKGKPQIEVSFTQAETAKVAPVVNRLLDEGPEVAGEMVPAILDATSSWMQQHPELVEKILIQLVYSTLGAVSDAQTKAERMALIAAGISDPDVLRAVMLQLAAAAR